MYCPNCGQEIQPGAKFCIHCGTAAPQAAASQPSDFVPTAYDAAPQQEAPLPMKWFKFTVYFQLFANAVLNLFNAISSFMGLSYGADAGMVYDTYPGLPSLDVLMGILYLALAAFAIVTRFQLVKFRKNGPMLLYVFLICNLAALIFYIAAATIITGLNLLDASTVSNAVTLAVLLVCDYLYFNKRKHLFVN